MITGVNDITLSVRNSVRNIEESFLFYRHILGFRAVAKWPQGAYFLAGDVWIARVVDENARQRMLPEYTPIAFTISRSDFDTLTHRIRSAGAVVWQDNWTEGASLYFIDPNGHKLEIHASDLATRMQTAREKPWEGLEFFDETAQSDTTASYQLAAADAAHRRRAAPLDGVRPYSNVAGCANPS